MEENNVKEPEVKAEKIYRDIEEGIREYIDGDEEIYEITTKDGVFEMKEVEYDKIRAAIKRGKASDREELCILSEMVFSKDGETRKIGELEFGKCKGSSIVKLAKAMNNLIDLTDFRI